MRSGSKAVLTSQRSPWTRVVPVAVSAPGERVGVAVEGGDRIGHFGRDQLGEPSQLWSAWPTMG